MKHILLLVSAICLSLLVALFVLALRRDQDKTEKKSDISTKPKSNEYFKVNLGDALFYDSVQGIIYLDPKYYYDTINWRQKYDSLLKRQLK